MVTLLNGKELAASLRKKLVTKIKELGFTPTLGVILVGNDPASHLYVNLKEKAAIEVGIKVVKKLFPENVDEATVKNQIIDFNKKKNINAILIQLPLPSQLNEQTLIETMDFKKDADGFHPQNLKLFLGGEKAITPGVSQGIIKLIELAQQNLTGQKAVLLVNSQEFAAPLIKLLNQLKMEVKVITQLEPTTLLEADVVIVAIGRPHTIKSEHIKNGTIVIDVGTTKLENHLMGDVDTAGLDTKDIFLTPVPGGVGPMTVAMLLWNVYYLATQN
jgi:methylenetetrahydrofolate dehydrogenase (NADP+)/methenyltetrahydrofolate cyclohydrolase